MLVILDIVGFFVVVGQARRFEICCCIQGSHEEVQTKQKGGCLYRLIERYYGHFILHKFVRPVIVSRPIILDAIKLLHFVVPLFVAYISEAPVLLKIIYKSLICNLLSDIILRSPNYNNDFAKSFDSFLIIFISLTATQMIVFVGWFCLCVSVVNKVEIGLDQKLAMPQVGHNVELDQFQSQPAVVLCVFSVYASIWIILGGGS